MYTNPHIDWALVALISFALMFVLLILYLRREDRREGYPLEDESGKRQTAGGVLFTARPKTYFLADGSTFIAPNGSRDRRPVPGRFASPAPGSPLIPVGDPLGACIGPGAYAERAQTPLLDSHGDLRIVPLRVATDFNLLKGGPDPRGMKVLGADRIIAGIVSDAWVDRSEVMVRYYEIALEGGDHVLVPATHCVVDGRQIWVDAIRGKQFSRVPRLASPDQITLDEEERICAFYGSGYLYAARDRAEPLL